MSSDSFYILSLSTQNVNTISHEIVYNKFSIFLNILYVENYALYIIGINVTIIHKNRRQNIDSAANNRLLV